MRNDMKETDLYLPVKLYFESFGYTVKGEVKGIDVVVMKDGLMVGIELKLHITLKLIYQAIERQKVCEKVYIAVPVEAIKSHKMQLRQFKLLCKKLNIGLLQVGNNQCTLLQDVNSHVGTKSIKNSKRKKKVRLEFEGRNNDSNLGGTKGKVFTKYKEKMVLIANLMALDGLCTIKAIKEKSKIYDVANIFQKNFYGWFERIERGKYALTERGIQELELANQVLRKDNSGL